MWEAVEWPEDVVEVQGWSSYVEYCFATKDGNRFVVGEFHVEGERVLHWEWEVKLKERELSCVGNPAGFEDEEEPLGGQAEAFPQAVVKYHRHRHHPGPVCRQNRRVLYAREVGHTAYGQPQSIHHFRLPKPYILISPDCLVDIA